MRSIRWLLLIAGCTSADVALDNAAVPPTPPPMIEAALSCQRLGTTGTPRAGTDLQRFDLATVYPDALCNDGSSAAIYYRPGVDVGRDHWLIELEGGGGCKTAQDCADRYCAVDPDDPTARTGFGLQQMSSLPYPSPGMVGTGIQGTQPQNPYRTYNHVLIHYCSSDAWTGLAPSQTGSGVDPIVRTNPVTFKTRFNGDAILFDTLRALRWDGTILTYNLVGPPTQMPDLDKATGNVVIAGGSAGGFGVVFQLDHIVDYLRPRHSSMVGPANYVGFVDSAFPPSLEGLSFQPTEPCIDSGACTYQTYVEATASYYPLRTDDSCSTIHAAPTDAFHCQDVTHVIHHHIGTPFFIRQGQTDSLLSDSYTETGLATATAPTVAMTVTDFESLVRTQANQIGSWSTAEEPPTTPVGAFVPDCPKHDPLHSDVPLFNTTIGTPGVTWQAIWGNWLSGSTPIRRVSAAGASFCP